MLSKVSRKYNLNISIKCLNAFAVFAITTPNNMKMFTSYMTIKILSALKNIT